MNGVNVVVFLWMRYNILCFEERKKFQNNLDSVLVARGNVQNLAEFRREKLFLFQSFDVRTNSLP